MIKTNTAVQPQYRYCRNKRRYCTNANWHGECSITACNKVRFPEKRYMAMPQSIDGKDRRMNAEKIHGQNVYVNLDEVIETVYQCRRDVANDEWVKRWFEPLVSLTKISIVHCRECKHRNTAKCAIKNDYDFCSDGERVEE